MRVSTAQGAGPHQTQPHQAVLLERMQHAPNPRPTWYTGVCACTQVPSRSAWIFTGK